MPDPLRHPGVAAARGGACSNTQARGIRHTLRSVPRVRFTDPRQLRRSLPLALLVLVLACAGALAQPIPSAPAAAAAPEAPKDPLGRDTPRGTVLGFLN